MVSLQLSHWTCGEVHILSAGVSLDLPLGEWNHVGMERPYMHQLNPFEIFWWGGHGWPLHSGRMESSRQYSGLISLHGPTTHPDM